MNETRRFSTDAVLVMLLVAAAAGAQGPRIKLAAEAWDFGVVRQGETRTHRIEITNEGTGTLRLIRAHTDCGCLKPNLGDLSVNPGETSELELVLKADRIYGKLRYVVRIRSNDALHRTATVTVSGEVTAPWWPSTRSLDLGAVPAGTAAEAGLAVHVRAGEKTKILGVRSSVPWVAVEHVPFGAPDAEHGWKVKLKVAPDAPVGAIEASLVVETDDDHAPAYEIVLTGEIVGPLTLSTTNLRFGTVPKGGSRRLEVAVSSSAGPFRVVSATCDDRRAATEVRQKPDSTDALIVVTLSNDGGRPGRFLTMLQIETDVSVQPHFKVRCVAKLDG